MRLLTNVIPVGDLKLHEAGEGCWCFPLLVEKDATLIHNAADCREAQERAGNPGEFGWVLVLSRAT